MKNASDAGFGSADVIEWNEAKKMGISNREIYDKTVQERKKALKLAHIEANKLGFQDIDSYKEAKNAGFKNKKIYDFAKSKGLKSMKDLKNFYLKRGAAGLAILASLGIGVAAYKIKQNRDAAERRANIQ